MDMRGGLGVARTTACRADDLDVGQKLHVERYRTRAIARRAAQSASVVAKCACLVAGCLGLGRAGEGATQFIMDVGISRYRRTHVGTDGRGVYQVGTCNALGIDQRTCFGRRSPAACALSAGMSVSSTNVVLPEPETPVTATRRPRGISTSSGLTV